MLLSTRFCCLLGAALAAGSAARAQTTTTTAPAWAQAVATGQSYMVGDGASAVDAAGNIYEIRSFTGTTVVGGTTLTSVGDYDGLLAKYTPDGRLAWVRQIGAARAEYALALAVDAAGNAYVTGFFSTPIALGNNVALTGTDPNSKAFLVRYSPQGVPQWAQQNPQTSFSSNSVVGSGLGLDAAGNLYWTGMYERQITLGGTTLTTPNPEYDSPIFLAKLSAATGAVQTLTSAFSYAPDANGGGRSHYWPRLAVVPTGELYLTTYFSESPVVGTTTFTSRGGTDLLVVKYSAQGQRQWAWQGGGPGDELVWPAQADPAGDLYLAGSFTGTATFGTTALSSTGGSDAYLAKLSGQSGTVQWAQAAGGPTTDTWNRLALDAAGNPYVAGSFRGTTRLGTTTLTSAGSADALVAAYAPTGQLRWAQPAGGPGSDAAHYLGLDAQGNLYVQGVFAGTARFGSLALTTAAAAPEAFLARLGTAALSTQAARPQPLALYPSPAADYVTLPALPAGTRVQLLDALGRPAREATVSAAAQVAVRGLRPGLYTLRTTDAQGRPFVGKVVVE